MKICVLVPSEDSVMSAGVRIRYRRIEHVLRAHGHDLEVTPVGNFRGQKDFVHDVYLVSKCYDARALVVARLLEGGRKLVGVDLFDDYFSQSRDSRFTGLRYWLRSLMQSADFALCSTPAMRELAASFAPQAPVHVMDDPALRPDAEAIGPALRRKLEYVDKTGILNVGWFGIGDNPYFPVGLADLAAFGGELGKLRHRGLDVRLSVLTNARAMTAHGLAMLRRLPVPYTVEEWTEERERHLLVKSLVCFLPVNAQNFSVTKSLNRAVSALCAGVQVLSSGYPLYEPLAPFVYRDPAKLLQDLAQGSLALREAAVPDLMRLLEGCADPVVEAQSLARFLESELERKSAAAPAAKPQSLVAVVHGWHTRGDVHKLVQRLGALSVSAPFCTAALNFDVRFSIADGAGFDVLIAEKHCPLLGQDLRGSLVPHGKVLDTTYRKLAASHVPADIDLDGMTLARMDSPMSVAASYPYVMANIVKTLEHLFPGVRCYHAEHAELPWRIPPRAEVRVREPA